MMAARPDPFTVPVVLLRVGWMNRYQGITEGDTISHGGAFVAEHGFGHEIFNFRPHGGFLYGYVQPPGRVDEWSDARINLTRLGAVSDAESVGGILAVWICVVTNALTDPRLEIFAYSPDSGRWESADRRVLHIQEISAARCRAGGAA